MDIAAINSTPKYRTIIVDDEPPALAKLSYLLKDYEDFELVAIVEKKYGKKLQFIYSFARNMMLDALITTLKDKKIVLCGQVETPAVYRGQRAKLLVKKFALVEE